jgi:hypothetical protein
LVVVLQIAIFDRLAQRLARLSIFASEFKHRLHAVSYLKLDSYFHNLRAWNFEICTRPLSVVMHEGE